MAYNFPIYRAPSVPKLSRKNITSPIVGRTSSSAGLRINRSRFRFGRQNVQAPNLIPEQTDNNQTPITPTINRDKLSLDVIKSINDSLIETNRVLVEIQNQLAIDFSTRIAEDRKQIGETKKQKFRKAAFNKEAALESVQSIGKGLFRQVDKVLTPAKSLFQKIIEFFKTILTGIIVNNVLNWLSKKENQQKLKVFLQFLADHWKWILGTLIAGKLLSGLLGVIGVVKRIKGAIDLLKGKGKLPGGGGGSPMDCSSILRCLKTSPEFANVLSYYMKSNPKVYGTIEGIAKGAVPLPMPPLVGPAGVPLNIPAAPRPRTAPSPQTSSLTPEQIWSLVKQNITDPGILSIIAAAGLTSMLDSPVPGPVDVASWSSASLGLLARFRALQAVGALKNAAGLAFSLGGVVPRQTGLNSPIPSLQPQKKKCDLCALGFSQGGSVGGSGSGTVDSVPAMLAPGEYVIRTAASKLFRPLLSDINENAGRLWNYFREAVTKLLEVTSLQRSNSERFSTILEDLNRTFEQKKQKENLKKAAKGGGFGRPIAEKVGSFVGTQHGKSTGIPAEGEWIGGKVGRQQGGQTYSNVMKNIPNVSINPVQNNVNIIPLPIRASSQGIPKVSSSRKSSSPVIIPVNLPTKKAAIPQVNLPQAPATYVPSIPSSNPANPYMMLTPSLYGIFV